MDVIQAEQLTAGTPDDVYAYVRELRAEAPPVKFSIGLSNISFGPPMHKVVNRVFLILALATGLDAAIPCCLRLFDP